MNKARFPLVFLALTAMYTSSARTRTNFDYCSNLNFADDGNETSDGAGGASTEAKAEIVPDTSSGEQTQQQAQTSDAVAPGTVLNANANDDKKVDTDVSDAGQVKAIGDPSAGQAQQV